MTSVVFTRSPQGLRLCCSGHAGYAEHGRDIVCAGISALCMALEEGLRLLGSRGVLREHFCEYADGRFCACAQGDAAPEQAVGAVFEAVYAGLCAVQREYPAYVSCRKENRETEVKE